MATSTNYGWPKPVDGDGYGNGKPWGQAFRDFIDDADTRVHRLESQAVNVQRYGAVGDGVTDDTVAIQAAINACVVNGKTLWFPSGVYMVSGLTVPGVAGQQVALVGEPGATLKANGAGVTIVTFAGDVTRSGYHAMHGFKIDGGALANVTGIRTGSATACTLQTYLSNLDVRRCAIGLDLYGAQEHSLHNVICYLNTIGLKMASDPTGGGGNSNTFVRCAFQQNTIGIFINNTSSYPLENNLFASCLIQNNSLCGAAIFGSTSGIIFDGTHMEANASAGTTLLVDTRTVYRCAVQVDNAGIAHFRDGSTSETQTPCFYLLNGAKLQLTNSWGYGNTGGVFIEGTLAETVEFYGRHAGSGFVHVNVGRWPDYFTPGVRFAAVGAPLLTHTSHIPNDCSNVNCWVPTLANAAGGASVADAMDPLMGPVASVQFTSTQGSTSTNRVTITALPTGVTAGDQWLVTLLVRADSTTNVTFAAQGGSYIVTQTPIDTQWKKLVLAFTAAANGTPNLYVYATGTDAPKLYCKAIQALRVASGGDPNLISGAVRHGWFNPNQNTYYYSAAPTAGTWKKGDRVVNVAPAVGQPKAWTCTVAGTPGTWVSEGNL